MKKWTTWPFDQAKRLFNTVGHRGAFMCGLTIINGRLGKNDSVDFFWSIYILTAHRVFFFLAFLSFSYFENIMHSCGTCLLCPQPPLDTHHPRVKGVSGSTQQLHLWSQILVKCIVKQILVPLCHCWVELVSNIWMPFVFCKC